MSDRSKQPNVVQHVNNTPTPVSAGDEVVISGVAGKFPAAGDVNTPTPVSAGDEVVISGVAGKFPAAGDVNTPTPVYAGDEVVISGVAGKFPAAGDVNTPTPVYAGDEVVISGVAGKFPAAGDVNTPTPVSAGDEVVISGVAGKFPAAGDVNTPTPVYAGDEVVISGVAGKFPAAGDVNTPTPVSAGDEVVISGVAGKFPAAGDVNTPTPVSAGDEVVISGIAGKFPAAGDVVQFMDNLYKKVDVARASGSDEGGCRASGSDDGGCRTIDGRDKFDAPFFRVTYKQAEVLDAACRMLLEQAYGAIYDAGVNPATLRGGKVGVYIGASYDNSYKMYQVDKRNIYTITGNGTKAMYANRISYWLDSKGPSCNVDAGEASALAALDRAYGSIRRGECDAAVVGAANLQIHHNLTKNMKSAGLCSADTISTTRAEAITVIFLQRLKDAKRVYAEIVYSQVGYNMSPDIDSSECQTAVIQTFIREFYDNANVSCDDVQYIETHSDVDPTSAEVRAILNVFGKRRPIEIGNIKHFMGNAQAAAGLCALTKICLAYQKGKLYKDFRPRTYRQRDIHSGHANVNIDASEETECFDTGYAAINSFSFGGTNAHVLLKCYQKKKCIEDSQSCIPRLVLASGRNEKCVNTMFDILKHEPLDAERIALLHNIHNTDIAAHTCRGYTILEAASTADSTPCNIVLSRDVQLYSGRTRPLWFVYSGMGSQWPEMGRALFRLPIFARAIQRCRKVLEPKGIDILNILTKCDKRMFDNILHSFVGIAAIQIGLTDLLYNMGIKPDYIIGHSVGELGCGYADGCLTAEEMILAAYSRGLVSIQTPFIHGAMAAIGLSHSAAQRLCPPEIEVACHNSATSSTVSGPADAVHAFVKRLKQRGIFAKEVQVSNIAYHSKYIAHAGPALLERLNDVIPTPKLRSKRWICTSLPPQGWDEPRARYCSAEYHTNNLLNPVYFSEASRLIPPDAIVIELAPTGLLEAIFRRSHPDALHVAMTKRWHSNPVKYILESIGKLYSAGLNPRIEVLYPKIHWPVSADTLSLSHAVRWAHAENWPNSIVEKREVKRTPVRDLLFSIHDDEYAYIKHFIRNGYNVFPEAAMLYVTWETLAMFKETPLDDLSVTFQNVIFHNELKISSENILKLNISINRGNDGFEVTCDEMIVASGHIRATPSHVNDVNDTNGSNDINGSNDTNGSKDTKGGNDQQTDPDKRTQTADNDNNIILSTDEVYKILYYRGYEFKNEFQSILSFDIANNVCVVQHSNNWITLIDSLIQLEILKTAYKGVSVPTCITKLVIDTASYKARVDGDRCKVNVSGYSAISRCACVELSNIMFANVPLEEPHGAQINEVVFVPYNNESVYEDATRGVAAMLQIVAENVADDGVTIVNVNATRQTLLRALDTAVQYLAHTGCCCNVTQSHHKGKRIHLVIGEDLLINDEKMSSIANFIQEDTFILTVESNVKPEAMKPYEIISKHLFDQHCMYLLRRPIQHVQMNSVYIHVNDAHTYTWYTHMQQHLDNGNEVVLVNERDPLCGLLGFVKKLNKETRKPLRLFIVDDYHALSFDSKNAFFREQLGKNLIINVLKQGKWGVYCYMPLPLPPPPPAASAPDDVTLRLMSCGDLDTLQWTQSHTAAATDTDTCVQVTHAGLSYRDCQRASGLLNNECNTFGMDYSGIDQRGERVMGLVASGATSSVIDPDTELTWPVPAHWSLEDAATVPMPYVYAYYCLCVRGQLRRGQHVLVTSGAGAVGQAAIAVCLSLECTVYTTVGDNAKKQFLLRLFPQLEPDNVSDSRDPTFDYSLLCRGIKCHFVVNSLTGLFRKAAMKCVASSGIMLNINDVDCNNSQHFGMHFLTFEKSIINVNLACLFKPQSHKHRKLLQCCIAEGIAAGVVRPLSRMVYSAADVKRAFNLLTSTNHRGRVLIQMGDTTLHKHINMLPNDKHYVSGVSIIVSCTNDLGIHLADHLVNQRGANKLIVNLKANTASGYARWKQQCWQRLGVQSILMNCELETEEECIRVIREGIVLGAVTGIYIVQGGADSGAGAADSHVDESTFKQKFRVTASVVAHLHHLSQHYCRELSEFVVITRTSNNSVDEYVASVCERVCESRQYVTLPALAVRAPLIREFRVGDVTPSATECLSIRSLFKAMDISLQMKRNNVHVFNPSRVVCSCTDVPGAECSCTEPDDLPQYIDRDEVAANEPVVPMQTSLGCAFEESEFVETDNCLMLIPGMEGHHRVFKSLCESLQILAVTLQMCPDTVTNSVTQIAEDMRASMVKYNIRPKSQFYLVGFSFGVIVALELAAILEQEGLHGVVYCMDSTPRVIRSRLNDYITQQTETCVQHIVLAHIHRCVAHTPPDRCLIDRLTHCHSWEDKVALYVTQLKQYGYSMQYITHIMYSTLNRIQLALHYDTDIKLRSTIVLLSEDNVTSDAEHDMRGYSAHAQAVTHAVGAGAGAGGVLHNTRVPNVINTYLHQHVLNEYKRQNMCIKYNV